MDEYISKTKFEELMRKKARNNFDLYYADGSKYYHARAVGCNMAADEAHDFPSADVQPVSQWISVKDRLPENHKLVLCYAQSTTGEGCCYILGTLSNDEFWFLQAHDGHHLSFPNLHLVVTHWQPLPDPPVNP